MLNGLFNELRKYFVSIKSVSFSKQAKTNQVRKGSRELLKLTWPQRPFLWSSSNCEREVNIPEGYNKDSARRRKSLGQKMLLYSSIMTIVARSRVAHAPMHSTRCQIFQVAPKSLVHFVNFSLFL